MTRRGTHLRPLSQGPGHAAGVAGGTSNSLAARKAALRRELRAARSGLRAAQRAAIARRAARQLLRMPRLRRARQVAVYLAAGNELDTDALIVALHARRKRVLVPVLEAGSGSRMRMCVLTPGGSTRRRRFGIREPVRRVRPRDARIDLVVLPLLGFDARGYRLGTGGGYYDRWLAHRRPQPYCVGYACTLQEIAEVPAEPWDRRMAAICTERGLRYFSRR